MKFGTPLTLLLSGVTLAFTTALSPAKAATTGETTTILHHVEVQEQLEARFVATVTIDTKTETVKAVILDDLCSTFSSRRLGHYCMAMPARLDSFELPYTKTVDSCGAVTFEASQDLRHVDGQRVQLTFVDYSESTCEYAIPGLHVLTIEVESLSANPLKYYALNKVTEATQAR